MVAFELPPSDWAARGVWRKSKKESCWPPHGGEGKVSKHAPTECSVAPEGSSFNHDLPPNPEYSAIL
jgi:hypothetical protein